MKHGCIHDLKFDRFICICVDQIEMLRNPNSSHPLKNMVTRQNNVSQNVLTGKKNVS